jgi:hypothetical protein
MGVRSVLHERPRIVRVTMSNRLPCLLASTILVVVGCGDNLPKANTLATASHGGQVFTFLDKSGGVELGSEPASPSAPGISRQNSHVIFAYFTQADGTTPLASTTTDVKIVPGTLPPIELKPDASAGRFISAPGPRLQDFRGVLEATIDGRKFEVPFNIR